MMFYRKDCEIRDEQTGNCVCIGGFCTAVNDGICQGLQNAYEEGKYRALKEYKERGDEHERKELARTFERWIKEQTKRVTKIREMENEKGCALFEVERMYMAGNQNYMDIPMYYVWKKDGFYFETVDSEKAYRFWQTARRNSE